MVYQPRINVVDATKFRDNILTHIQTNQAEALTWANANRVLPEIKDFHKSRRLVTVFPALTVLQMEHRSQWEEILEIDFSITFETALIHGNKDTLSDMGPKYSMALESMIANLPETTFNQDSIIEIESTAMSIETVFAVQGQYKNQFIEVFQTKAAWRIEASAFNQ